MPFNPLQRFHILLRHASAGLCCRSRASRWHSCSTDSTVCVCVCVWMCVCMCVFSFNTQQSSPCLLLLVCPSVCLSHFHAPDWFKLNCPSCSYHIHPPRLHTRTGKYDDSHVRTHNAALWSSCQHRPRQHFLFAKCLETQLFSCLDVRVSAHLCVGVCVCVCHTYSEVSERRPLKASAAMSEIWFLLKSLEGEREWEGEGGDKCITVIHSNGVPAMWMS